MIVEFIEKKAIQEKRTGFCIGVMLLMYAVMISLYGLVSPMFEFSWQLLAIAVPMSLVGLLIGSVILHGIILLSKGDKGMGDTIRVNALMLAAFYVIALILLGVTFCFGLVAGIMIQNSQMTQEMVYGALTVLGAADYFFGAIAGLVYGVLHLVWLKRLKNISVLRYLLVSVLLGVAAFGVGFGVAKMMGTGV